MQSAVRIKVYGRVQGVAYRYYSSRKAEELGLVGFVKNLSDGSVLAEVCGDSNDIDNFVLWCEVGSPASEVQKVIAERIDLFESDMFKIIR